MQTGPLEARGARAYCDRTTLPLGKTTTAMSLVISKPREASMASRLRCACPVRIGSWRSASETPRASSVSRVTVRVGIGVVQLQLFMITPPTIRASTTRTMTAQGEDRVHSGIMKLRLGSERHERNGLRNQSATLRWSRSTGYTENYL